MVILPQSFALDIIKTGDWGSNARRNGRNQTHVHGVYPEADGGKLRTESTADYK
jgi:hypothetical protein